MKFFIEENTKIQTLLVNFKYMTCTLIIVLAYGSTSNFLGTSQLLRSVVTQLFFFQTGLLSAPNTCIVQLSCVNFNTMIGFCVFLHCLIFPFS